MLVATSPPNISLCPALLPSTPDQNYGGEHSLGNLYTNLPRESFQGSCSLRNWPTSSTFCLSSLCPFISKFLEELSMLTAHSLPIVFWFCVCFPNHSTESKSNDTHLAKASRSFIQASLNPGSEPQHRHLITSTVPPGCGYTQTPEMTLAHLLKISLLASFSTLQTPSSTFPCGHRLSTFPAISIHREMILPTPQELMDHKAPLLNEYLLCPTSATGTTINSTSSTRFQ